MEVAFCPQRQPRSMSRKAYRELYRTVRIARRQVNANNARWVLALRLPMSEPMRRRVIDEMVNPPLVVFGEIAYNG